MSPSPKMKPNNGPSLLLCGKKDAFVDLFKTYKKAFFTDIVQLPFHMPYFFTMTIIIFMSYPFRTFFHIDSNEQITGNILLESLMHYQLLLTTYVSDVEEIYQCCTNTNLHFRQKMCASELYNHCVTIKILLAKYPTRLM